VRHKATHGKQDAEVDLTPMLDIVFIMLIFFIVTATFVTEAGLDVTKPDAQDNPPPSAAKSMRIIVTDTNRILINMRDVDSRAVRANVERFRAENPKGSVVIQTDSKSKTGVVVSVMDQVKLAGAPVSIAAADG
jgi:biopolymer transport protein ExbD